MTDSTNPLGRTSPRRTVVIFLLVLAFALLFQGSRGLWEPDEGRYTDVALEMLRLGDFLNPSLHHELPHFSKPPLTYWTLAGSFALFGRNEWAARLPLALAFAFTVLAVYWMGRRLVPEKPWLPALVYGTSLMPFVGSNVVSTDAFLTLWEAVAVLGFVALRWDGTGGRERLGRNGPFDAHAVMRLVLWGGFGLAFMTKGPPALLPLLAILAFRLIERGARRGDDGHDAGPRWVTPGALLFFLVVAGTWFVTVIALDPSLLGYFLRYEVADRVFTTVHGRNPAWYGAFTVYVPTLLVGTLPWTLPVFRGLRRLPRLLTGRFWGRLRRDEPELLFLLLWFLVPLAVFSVARSRLPLYVLPLFAPISLLIGRHLARRDRPFAMTRRRLAWLGLWIVVLVGLKATAAYLPNRPEDSRRMARAIEAQVTAPYTEIAFLDRSPRYGLSLYLGVEIERLTLARYHGPPRPHPRIDSLEEELTEGENPLFVTDLYQAGTFVLRAREAGYRALEQGTYGDEAFFVLEPSPASAASTP